MTEKMNKVRPIKKHPSFLKTDDGKDIFYPWGYPGEGIFLEGKQKLRLIFGLFAYFVFVGSWIASAILLQKLHIISSFIGTYMFLIFNMVLIPAYVFVIHLFKRGKEFLTVTKKDRPAKSEWVWMIVLSGVCQIEGFYLVAVYADEMSSVFLAFYSLGFIFTSYVLLTILRTRGYYFSK